MKLVCFFLHACLPWNEREAIYDILVVFTPQQCTLEPTEPLFVGTLAFQGALQ